MSRFPGLDYFSDKAQSDFFSSAFSPPKYLVAFLDGFADLQQSVGFASLTDDVGFVSHVDQLSGIAANGQQLFLDAWRFRPRLHASEW